MIAWQQRAACRDYDPRLWDSDTGIVAQEIGKAVCANTCPVRNDCGAAGKDEPESTWGGLDPMERLGLMLLATPEPVAHVASRAHYVQGCRRPECCEANTRWIAEYRAREVVVTTTATVDLGEQLSLEVSA